MKNIPFVRLSLLAAVGAGVALPMTAMADFVKDSKASLSMRNLYFNGDNRDGAAAPSKTEEWAQGFILKGESGYTEGTIGFGLDAMALVGVTLDSGRGRHVGSSMIPSDGDRAADTWSRFAPTATAGLAKSELRIGTLQPKLPILVSNDGRLLPQTFQGGQVTSKDIKDLTLTGGILNRATGRFSSDQGGLAAPGGSEESNKFTYAGADYNITKELKAQYYFANLEDYYDQHFLGLLHTLPIDENSSLTTDARFFRTMSDGKNSSSTAGYRTSGYTKNNDGEIDNTTWSLFSTYAYKAHSFTLGYQQVGEDSNFTQLNQGSIPGGEGGASVYLFTDRMIQSFIRAGERTKFGQYAYDFASLGVPGLKASVVYLKGDNIQTRTAGNQSEWERDLALDYVQPTGTFKGLGVSLRNGMARGEAARDQDQTRVIVNYTIPLI